jgi:hypothetical protein
MGLGCKLNDYEIALAKLDCRVFAFDCTSDVQEMKAMGHRHDVTFLPWCVGKNSSTFEGNAYSRINDVQRPVFFSLPQIMARLGHASISVLMFDIEGFEWDFFETLYSLERLPKQIAFELHSEKCPSRYCPEQQVRGRNAGSVRKLFVQLNKLGYSLVSRTPNSGAPEAACDFTMILFSSSDALEQR